MRPAAGLTLFLLALSGRPAVPAAAQTAPAGQAAEISRIERGLLPPIVIRGRPLPLSSIEERMRQLRVPGVSVAVIRGGSIAWAKGYGLASERPKRRLTKDTLFEAGSISKEVTAVAALRLVAEGKLTLDGDVEGELKSWKIPENKFTREHPVTLRELLSHTAGMTVHGFPRHRRDGPIPSLAQVLDGVKPQVNTDPVHVDAVPGTLWRYSGGGYAVVQQLLIDTAGESFPELVRRQVLAPLHMAQSTFEQPLPKRFWGRAASGYRADGSAVPGGWHVYPEMAAAGLWTTATDLARYVIAIQAAAAGRPGGMLSPEMARAMQTPVIRGYGFGLQVRGEGQTLRFSTAGWAMGSTAILWRWSRETAS
jgi:CubicO group peptidase (beta-lactamase class C family)